MSNQADIEARSQRLSEADARELNKTTHGIAARLDRLPIGNWHRKLMWIFGGAVFCDCLDMYIGGGVIASLLADGWSTVELNGQFQTVTMLGYLIGALISGYLGDKFGRRNAILLNITIFSIATLAASFSPSMEVLIAARGLMGIGLGAMLPGAYGSFPEYIPPTKRARYSGMIGLIGNFSPPLGAALTMVIIPIFGWRPIFVGIAIISFIIMLVFWKFVPESPRWLASKGRYDEADKIVTEAEQSFAKKGITLPEISHAQIEELSKEVEVKQLPYSSLFKKNMIRRTITICAALMAMNLIVYTITTWTPTIFVMNGLDVAKSIGMTVVMLLGAPVGILLLTLFGNKHGRKVGLVVCLLLLSAAGYFWSLQTDETIIMISGFVLCVICYYYSLLACSVYIGEVFPTELRLRGAGFANAMGRVAAIVSPTIIAMLLQASGVVSVYIFVGICLIIFAIIIGVFGVETRNKSLEEINDHVVSEFKSKESTSD